MDPFGRWTSCVPFGSCSALAGPSAHQTCSPNPLDIIHRGTIRVQFIDLDGSLKARRQGRVLGPTFRSFLEARLCIRTVNKRVRVICLLPTCLQALQGFHRALAKPQKHLTFPAQKLDPLISTAHRVLCSIQDAVSNESHQFVGVRQRQGLDLSSRPGYEPPATPKVKQIEAPTMEVRRIENRSSELRSNVGPKTAKTVV